MFTIHFTIAWNFVIRMRTVVHEICSTTLSAFNSVGPTSISNFWRSNGHNSHEAAHILKIHATVQYCICNIIKHHGRRQTQNQRIIPNEFYSVAVASSSNVSNTQWDIVACCDGNNSNEGLSRSYNQSVDGTEPNDRCKKSMPGIERLSESWYVSAEELMGSHDVSYIAKRSAFFIVYSLINICSSHCDIELCYDAMLWFEYGFVNSDLSACMSIFIFRSYSTRREECQLVKINGRVKRCLRNEFNYYGHPNCDTNNRETSSWCTLWLWLFVQNYLLQLALLFCRF